jgi:hypothetical protein
MRMSFSKLTCYSGAGIPYMSLESVLMFKAKHLREKDQADFEKVLPLLDDQQFEWLRVNPELVHPGHTCAEVLQR